MKTVIHPGVIALCLALIVVAVISEGGARLGIFSGAQKSLEAHAEAVITTCSKDSYPPRCYDDEIPRLMDTGLSMEEAFEVTRIIQSRVSNYFYCHVLGHNISARETIKDPSRWTEVVARCPVGMCSNGCLHGAAQERFRAESLTPEEVRDLIPQLETICEGGNGRNYTGLEQASCYHSMGHLSMYITGAHIETATDVCDEIAVKENGGDYTQTCYEGAYMQIFQPLEPEDFALVADIAPTTTTEAQVYCDQFSGEYRSACYRESWPLYRESLQQPGGLERFCNLISDSVSMQRCYNAMFYVLTAQFNFEEPRVIALCETLSEKRKAQCFANAASRMIETDYRLIPNAVRLCTVAETHGVGERCYGELLFYSTFNFEEGSEGFRALCTSLPEPWKRDCFDGKGRETHPSANDS